MATSIASHHLFLHHRPLPHRRLRPRSLVPVRALGRSDLDGFARRVASGEALRDAWRSANSSIEVLAFEARRAAERLDRRFSVSRRFDSAARSLAARAREVDQELGIGRQFRTFSVDFSRNWPRYRKEFQDFMETPLDESIRRDAAAIAGCGFITATHLHPSFKTLRVIFFIWFVLSGWWFRLVVLSLWVLPLASPLLIGLSRNFVNNFVIEGACPACKKRFVGYRNQIVRCTSCRNVVWQPAEDFSRGNGGRNSKTSEPDIIDIEIEEK